MNHTPKKAIVISLAVSIVLLLAKFGAFFYTYSNAILTDAAESIVNVIASAFALYSIYLSELPKDENHPYGHGKVQFFSVFIEGTLIIVAGLAIAVKASYDLIFQQNTLSQISAGALLIGATGLVNLILALYLIRQGKKHHSIALEADGKHIITDAVSSGGLMLALFLIYFTHLYWLDSVISLALSIYIVVNGYQLLRKSIAGLMDESNPEIISEVVDLLQKYRKPTWIDVHNLRLQQYGANLHIDCHVTLPFYFDLVKVHQEVSAIAEVIASKSIHEIEFFIHADPCISPCCNYCSVENCPSRKFEFQNQITWEIGNVTKNQKHF